MKWNDLTMKERSDLMSLFLKHGIGSLSDMRRIYDEGGEIGGGELEPAVVIADSGRSDREFRIPYNPYFYIPYIMPLSERRKEAMERLSLPQSSFKEYLNEPLNIRESYRDDSARMNQALQQSFQDSMDRITAIANGSGQSISGFSVLPYMENSYVSPYNVFAEGGDTYDGEGNTDSAEVDKDRKYYLKLYQAGEIPLDKIPKEFIPWIQGETSPVRRAVIEGRTPGPIFSKERVVDRVPGDEFNMANTGEKLMTGTRNPVHAFINYLFNKPGYVEERIRRAEGTGAEFDLKTHEDAKRVYYGYSPKYGMLEKAKDRPTIGKAEKETYQVNPLLSDAEFEGLIFPAWAAWKTGDKTFTTMGDWDPYLEGNPEVQRIIDEDKDDSKATLKDIPYLHDATISEGFDNKGHYISLYDKWDYSFKPTGGGKDAIGAVTGGKPFDIYQRYYLDEWNDIPEESRGNPWIAPSIITDYLYMNGGKLKKKSKRFGN